MGLAEVWVVLGLSFGLGRWWQSPKNVTRFLTAVPHTIPPKKRESPTRITSNYVGTSQCVAHITSTRIRCGLFSGSTSSRWTTSPCPQARSEGGQLKHCTKSLGRRDRRCVSAVLGLQTNIDGLKMPVSCLSVVIHENSIKFHIIPSTGTQLPSGRIKWCAPVRKKNGALTVWGVHRFRKSEDLSAMKSLKMP